MKSIMLCLEKMDIGGIETSVINQVLEYKRRGINVVVVAQEGIYVDVLKKCKIKFEKFEFSLDKNIDMQKIALIEKIIKKYEVEAVIVNQLPCILSVLPACYELGIPYVAYVHTADKMIQDNEYNMYDWFERNFAIFKYLLPLYFSRAQKVIAISENAGNYVRIRYNIQSEKIIVIKNSINIDLYKTKNKVNKRERFLLISRFSNEKMDSIKNAIEIFKCYEAKNKTLSIVGSGPMIDNVKELIHGDNRITLLGPSNEVIPMIDEHDVILGLDRTILEAITMKKIAVIVGYRNPKQIITNENINLEANEGFSGYSLEDTTAKELAKQIKEKEVDLEYNYNYVSKNLNIKNNIYIENDFSVKYDYKDIFSIIEQIDVSSLKEMEEKLEFNNDTVISGLRNELEQEKQKNKELNNDLCDIKQELLNVYSSKRYKFMNEILKIFNK